MPPSSASFIGLNWGWLARVSAMICAGGVLLLFWPAALCSYDSLDAAELPTLAEGEGRLEAVQAVGNAEDGFLSRTASSTAACFRRWPPTTAPVWQQGAAGGGLAGFVLFSIMAAIDRRRQAAIVAAKHRQARRAITRETDVVLGSGAYLAPRTATSSAPVAAPRASSSSSVRVASRFGDDADPLAVLDAALAKPAPRRAAPAAAAAPAAPAATTPATVDPFAATFRAKADPIVQAELLVPPAADLAPPTAAATAAGLPDDLPSLDDLDGWGDPPPARQAHNTTEAPRAARTAHAGLPADDLASAATSPQVVPPDVIPAGAAPPSVDDFDGPAPVLGGVHVRDPLRVGRDLTIEIAGVAEGSADALTVSLTVESASGLTAPVWAMARRLKTAGRVAASPIGLALVVPWRELAPRVLALSREENDSAVNVHVTVNAGALVAKTRAPVVDDLVLFIADRNGTPLGPRTILVTTAGGRVIRGWVSAEAPGIVRLSGLEPGTCRIEMEDATPLGVPSGPMQRAVHLSTVGVAFTGTAADIPSAARHDLVGVVPAVRYVSAMAAPDVADGSRLHPFSSIRAALEPRRLERTSPARDDDYLEVRVDPTATLPTARHGIVAGANGSAEWVNWWTGHAADPRLPWVVSLPSDQLRTLARPAHGTALAEDVDLSRLQNIRIINAGYAEFRDRVARSPGFQINLHQEYGSIPQAVIVAPESGPTATARVLVESAQNVLIEGLHLLGCPSQSGVIIRDARGVTVRRCWIDLFEGGPLPRGGGHGIGRGVQIDQSGGATQDTAIAVAACDIGWNRAARRGMPIKGAGIAVYDSNVDIAGCFVHDNVATDEPADVAVQGNSRVRGEHNHRVGNRVAT